MNDFIKSFSTYSKTAQFESIAFWAFPLCTIVFIWLITTVGLKIFSNRKKMKTVFLVNRAWMISSLIAAAILIGTICFCWSKNYFSQRPWQLSLLISLTISMLIPVFCLFNLRNYYTREDIKEVAKKYLNPNQRLILNYGPAKEKTAK